MKKIILWLILLSISIWNTYALGEVKIITRAEWGADESYTDINTPFWQSVIQKRKESVATPAQLAYRQKQAEKTAIQNAYINENFAERYESGWKIGTLDGIELAWPIDSSTKVDAIMVHHTASEYNSSAEWIKKIYKYHSLSNWWWDIWYNYIIWYEGQIYEGRLGWEYAIWAHSTWNNHSSIGVSLMWNFENRDPSDQQLESLKNLIWMLINTYDIDMNTSIPLHKTSTSENFLSTDYFSPIVWHRDWGHTSCPWENLYKHLPELNIFFKNEFVKDTSNTLDFSVLNSSPVVTSASIDSTPASTPTLSYTPTPGLYLKIQKYVEKIDDERLILLSPKIDKLYRDNDYTGLKKELIDWLYGAIIWEMFLRWISSM